MAPAATCTFCSRRAATTSLAERLRAAILLGSSPDPHAVVELTHQW